MRIKIMALIMALFMALTVGFANPASAHPTKKNSHHDVQVHRGGMPDGCGVQVRKANSPITGLVVLRAYCARNSGWVPASHMFVKSRVCTHLAVGGAPCARWAPWRITQKKNIPAKDWVHNEIQSARIRLIPGIFQYGFDSQVAFTPKSGGKNSIHRVWRNYVFRGGTIDVRNPRGNIDTGTLGGRGPA